MLNRHKAVVEYKFNINMDNMVQCAALDLKPYLGNFEVRSRSDVDAFLSQADLHSESVLKLAALRQIQALWKKDEDAFGSTEQERKLKARKTFFSSEKDCSRANRKLSWYTQRWSRRPQMWQYLSQARDIIVKILGPLDDQVLQGCYDLCGFGPGSTFGSQELEDRTLYRKLRYCTVTADALPYFREYQRTSSNYWRPEELKIVRGNRLAFVPKDAQTKRTIAIEPSLNVFLQLGFDRMMRRRLRRWGVDLSDQQPNRVGAMQGSRDGSLATIDLSSASDTISKELVRYMLPFDWFTVLDSLRSPEYLLDGKWSEYEKFSSMGNALTFPLETLIFFSLAYVVCTESERKQIKVYGDDILVPTNKMLLVMELLSFAGFTPNPTKSFGFGKFRESCGADCYSGVDIRPVYVKSSKKLHLHDVYNLHNRLATNRVGFSLPRVLQYLQSLCHIKLYGPPDLGASDPMKHWILGDSAPTNSWLFTNEPKRLKILKSGASGWEVECIALRPGTLEKPKDKWAYLAFLAGDPAELTYIPGRTKIKLMKMLILNWSKHPGLECMIKASA